METTALTDRLASFISFVRSRTGDAELAADIVQDCLLKAIRSDISPADDEAAIQWFYRVLRNAVIDSHRRREVREHALATLQQEWPEHLAPPDERRLCQCISSILPGLPEPEADLLRRVDLNGESPSSLAAASGERVNTLNVRLHRARKHLREHLERICRTCAKHGCLDCDCA